MANSPKMPEMTKQQKDMMAKHAAAKTMMAKVPKKGK